MIGIRIDTAMTHDPDISVFRPDRPGIRKVLGDLEADIMEFVWARPSDTGTTVRDVYEALSARRRIAYTTVMSTMSRLAKKRLLRTEKAGQTYIYHPTVTEAAFVSRFVGRILDTLLVGFTDATLAHLGALPDPEAARRAQQLLEETARRRPMEEDQ
jgi:predicted transcriptional regulator